MSEIILHHLFPSLVFVVLSIFGLKWIFLTKNTKLNKLPPSPYKLPVIGNLHQLGLLPHRKLASLAQCHGSLMLLNLGSVRTLVVSSASSAQEVMKTHDVFFSDRPNLSVFHKLMYGRGGISSAPYGENWRQLRSLVVQQLLSPRKVQTYKTIREEETALMMGKIEKMRGEPFDLSELLAFLPVDITCRVAFGKKYNEEKGAMRFNKLLEEFSSLLGAFDVGDVIPWLAWVNKVNGRNSRINKVAEEFDFFIERVISDHISSSRPQDQMDIIDVLLEIQSKNSKEVSNGSFKLSRDHIKGVVLDMFLGGTETITTVMEWAMTELIRHPEKMERVQNEIRGLNIGRHQDNITEDEATFTQMEYLKAVIKETHRLHPAGALLFPRESTQSVKIQGYDIPSNTRVVVNAWAIGRDPCSWDNPEEFNPERFLRGDSTSARDFKGQSFELIPFGAGRRICPGIGYANAILELALVSLLHKFEWSLPDGAMASGLDTSESFGLSVAKKYPLMVVATRASTD